MGAAAQDKLCDSTRATDDALIRLVAQGDRVAFRELFDRHHVFVRRIVLGHCGFTEELDDIVQDVFLRVFKKASSFRGESSFSSWLYRLTINVALDAMRKTTRNRKTFVGWTDDCDQIPGEKGLDAILDEEQRHRVQAAIGRIKESRREVFVLFELEGQNLQEISETLKLPMSTIWSRLHNARKEFISAWRRMLTEEEPSS